MINRYFARVDLFKQYDRWTWQRSRRHLLYWFLWTTFFVTTNTLTGPEYSFWQWLAFEAIVLPVKIISAYVIAYGIMPRYLYPGKYGAFLIAMLSTAFCFAAILYGLYATVIHPLILIDPNFFHVSEFIFKGVELVYIAALVMAIKFFQNYLHEQERNQSLAEQKVAAELKYLKNQVQPHFLFNTLNNIYGMILADDKNAADYIVRLSDLLSYMLYESNTPTIALNKEIEMLESFIELERLRYHRKLDFSYTKSEPVPALPIAPLLLVPFLENAFKHGPAKEEGRSFIRLDISVKGNLLHFTVENSTVLETTDENKLQSGIGLANIRKRLALLYPDQHTLTIQAGATYRVDLQLELNTRHVN